MFKLKFFSLDVLKSILLPFVLISMAASCSNDSELKQASRAIVPADLETAEVIKASIPREIMFDGVVEAVNEATVSAQTTGRVSEVNFDVGWVLYSG